MGNQVSVYFDDEQISVIQQDGTAESIMWRDLTAVMIKTTDQGPFNEDAFFILIGKDEQSDCVVPHGASGESDMFSALQQRLAGFDNEKAIEAMSSTKNNTFLVWRKTKSTIKGLITACF
jgi:hypothetical protein